MRRGLSISTVSFAIALAIGIVLLVNPITITSCRAETGVLKLKVRGCVGTNWLSNARIDVVIDRPGVGQVDSASGFTNSSGYIEFDFKSLQTSDEAHVTVTPSGQGADSNHVYYWSLDDLTDEWELGMSSDSLCSDSWYDSTSRIFLCVYNTP
jgi:hypothetical protein